MRPRLIASEHGVAGYAGGGYIDRFNEAEADRLGTHLDLIQRYTLLNKLQ